MDRKECYRFTHPMSKISGYTTASISHYFSEMEDRATPNLEGHSQSSLLTEIVFFFKKSKIEAKFRTFWPCKIERWTKYPSQFSSSACRLNLWRIFDGGAAVRSGRLEVRWKSTAATFYGPHQYRRPSIYVVSGSLIRLSLISRSVCFLSQTLNMWQANIFDVGYHRAF